MLKINNTNNIEKINPSGNQIQTQKTEDAARAFVATFKQACELAQIAPNDKKEKNEDRRRKRRLTPEDYDSYNEVDELLEEIDSRLDKMLDIAKQME